MLEETKIEGGDIMQTLAQRFRDEGKEKWMNYGKKEGIKEGILNTARRMLNNGYSIKNIEECTGLTEKEIKQLIN
jgi:predicted transposase/invertase (TIGR01784 family)